MTFLDLPAAAAALVAVATPVFGIGWLAFGIAAAGQPPEALRRRAALAAIFGTACAACWHAGCHLVGV